MKFVHDAAVVKPNDVHEGCRISVGPGSPWASHDEQEGLQLGTDIEKALVTKLETEDEERKVEDAKQTQDQAIIVEDADSP